MERHKQTPGWLNSPPEETVPPPVTTRLQILPFDQLTWKDFERLCLRLVRQEGDVEHCQLYGTEGQQQQGIDIFARRSLSSNFRVYQCKKVQQFGPAKISKAVDKFIKGDWATRTEFFILCTCESMRATLRAKEVERQVRRLRQRRIGFLVWDEDHLSELLKGQPELVDDFFGREWVKAFNGEETARLLGPRLDAIDMRKLRGELFSLYSNVFEQHDPGFYLMAESDVYKLSLERRFVVPDIATSVVETRPGVTKTARDGDAFAVALHARGLGSLHRFCPIDVRCEVVPGRASIAPAGGRHAACIAWRDKVAIPA